MKKTGVLDVQLTAETTQATDLALVSLKRIRGQLDGVIRMYEEQRACVDIVRQVIAARSSLGRVARDLLTSEASQCSQERRIGDLDTVLKELFKYE